MLDIVELCLVSTIFCERSAVSPGLLPIIIEVAQKNKKEQQGTACHPTCPAYIMSSMHKLRPLRALLLPHSADPRDGGFARRGFLSAC